jgi:hypothetical protein
MRCCPDQDARSPPGMKEAATEGGPWTWLPPLLFQIDAVAIP